MSILPEDRVKGERVCMTSLASSATRMRGDFDPGLMGLSRSSYMNESKESFTKHALVGMKLNIQLDAAS